MKLSLNFLLIWISNIFLLIISAKGQFSVLSFLKNGDNYELIDMEVVSMRKFDILIWACPADDEDAEERVLNEISTSKNILLIKKTFTTKRNLPDHKICKKQFSPSVIWNEKINFYHLGYETYFDYEFLEKLPDISSMDNWELEFNPRIQNTIHKFVKLGEAKNVFWYTEILVQFKFSEFWKTIHKVSEHQYMGKIDECENYNLGFKMIDENFDEIYNRSTVLEKFNLPGISDEEKHKYYLVKHQLSPINDFDSNEQRLVTCSHFNVIPIWNTITIWEKIERIIKKLSESVLLEVSTGTFGELRLPKSEPPFPLEKVLLNHTPVPKIVWKLIQHSFHSKDQGILRYSIIIFSYNYISNALLAAPFCGGNVCSELGWNDVENTNYSTGFTYCCRVTNNILSRLGITYFFPSDDLDLRSLKVESNEDGAPVGVNVIKKLGKMTINES